MLDAATAALAEGKRSDLLEGDAAHMMRRGARYKGRGVGEGGMILRVHVTVVLGWNTSCGNIDVAVLKWCLLLARLWCFDVSILRPHYIVLYVFRVVD